MSVKRVACVVGARPNFVKMAPLMRAFEAHPTLEPTLIHTGQHYDANLSDVFFEELGLRKPDVSLEVGSGRHGEQTARILERMEATLIEATADGRPFDWLVVVGDVNSTLAAAIAAAKLGIGVAHVEAGLRSRDRSMPEEINRLATDAISDLLLASEPAAVTNLRGEGQPDDRVHLVGNVMIDTLDHVLPLARERSTPERLGLMPREYGVVTVHRPSNVDDPRVLERLFERLLEIAERIPLVFPVHPRTASRLAAIGMDERLESSARVRLAPPMGYVDFLSLTASAGLVITDSGGLQEETTALGVPCLTMRANTERPVTVESGTSTLVGGNAEQLASSVDRILGGTYKEGRRPELWDGHAAERIADILGETEATR